MKKIMIIDGDALGEPEHINAYNTYQVKNYDRFELAAFSESAKRQYRDEHWGRTGKKPTTQVNVWPKRWHKQNNPKKLPPCQSDMEDFSYLCPRIIDNKKQV